MQCPVHPATSLNTRDQCETHMRGQHRVKASGKVQAYIQCPFPDCEHPRVWQPTSDRYWKHFGRYHSKKPVEAVAPEETDDDDEEVEDVVANVHVSREVQHMLESAELQKEPVDWLKESTGFPDLDQPAMWDPRPRMVVPISRAAEDRWNSVRKLLAVANMDRATFASIQAVRDALAPRVSQAYTDFSHLSTLSKQLHNLKYLAYSMAAHGNAPYAVATWIHQLAVTVTNKSHFEQQSRGALAILDPIPILNLLNPMLDRLWKYYEDIIEPRMLRWLEDDSKPSKRWLLDELRPWIECALRFDSLPLPVSASTDWMHVCEGWMESNVSQLDHEAVGLYWNEEHHRLVRTWVPGWMGKRPARASDDDQRLRAQRVHLPIGRVLSAVMLWYRSCLDSDDVRFYGSKWRLAVHDTLEFLTETLQQPHTFTGHRFYYDSCVWAVARHAVGNTNAVTGHIDLDEMQRFCKLIGVGFAESDASHRTWAQWRDNEHAIHSFSRAFSINMASPFLPTHMPPVEHRLRDDRPPEDMEHKLLEIMEP